jgi:hypothetical protein
MHEFRVHLREILIVGPKPAMTFRTEPGGADQGATPLLCRAAKEEVEDCHEDAFREGVVPAHVRLAHAGARSIHNDSVVGNPLSNPAHGKHPGKLGQVVLRDFVEFGFILQPLDQGLAVIREPVGLHLEMRHAIDEGEMGDVAVWTNSGGRFG